MLQISKIEDQRDKLQISKIEDRRYNVTDRENHLYIFLSKNREREVVLERLIERDKNDKTIDRVGELGLISEGRV